MSKTLKDTLRATLIPLATMTIERLIDAMTLGIDTTSTQTSNKTKPRSVPTRKTNTRRPAVKSNVTKLTASKRSGRTPISDKKRRKIVEGFNKGYSAKKIAEYADVSVSSAVRYTAPLRNKTAQSTVV